MQDGICSWALCVRNEWLDFSFATLPGEDALRDVHLKGALLVGSALHQCEGSGVFVAELHAIARAIMSAPANSPLHIYSDSLSAIHAISSFAVLRRQRSRLRCAGRPLLALITRLITRKKELGATVMISWIEAHSTLSSIHHVGNRCADFAAKRACTGRPLASIKPLSLGPEGRVSGFGALLMVCLALRCWATRAATACVCCVRKRSTGGRPLILSLSLAPFTLTCVPYGGMSFLPIPRLLTSRFVCCPTRSNGTSVMVSMRNGSASTHVVIGMRLALNTSSAAIMPGLSVLVLRWPSTMHWPPTAPLAIHFTAGDCLRQILVDAGVLVAVSKAAEVAAMVGIFDSSRVKKVLARAGVEQHLRDPLVLTLRSILINWAARAWRRLFDC